MTNSTKYSDYLTNHVSNYNKFKISKFQNKNVYIPAIGKIDPNLYYSLDKNVFERSRLYVGDNKFTKIDTNIYIRFEGNTHFFPKKWFINTIKKINRNYKKVFNEIKPLYFQIKQVKQKFCYHYGGVASDHGVEIILNLCYIPDKNKIKWIIAHELFHLYCPPLNYKYKYGSCWNEGLVDYLSLYYNFTNTQLIKTIKNKIKEFENINKIKEKEYYKHKKPYITGLLIGHKLTKIKLNKLINFIKKYIKNRKYIFEHTDDIKFVKEMGFYTKDC